MVIVLAALLLVLSVSAYAVARPSGWIYLTAEDLDSNRDGTLTRVDFDGRRADIALPWDPAVSAVSPTGDRIAVFDRATRRLVVARLDFAHRRLATRHTLLRATYLGAVAWSPGERDLAFAGTVHGRSGFWRLPATGHASPRYLGSQEAGYGDLAWCRCGDLAYAVGVGSHGILMLTATRQSTPAPFTAPPPNPHPENVMWMEGLDQQPHWSPDGSQLLFVRIMPSDLGTFDPEGERLLVKNRRSHQVRGLTTGAFLSLYQFAWSPTGSEIAIAEQVSLYASISAITFPGGQPVATVTGVRLFGVLRHATWASR